MEYLESRLKDVAAPFDVLALDKSRYYDDQYNLNSEKLVNDIAGNFKGVPTILSAA